MSFFTKIWNSVFYRKLSREVADELETHLGFLEDEAKARGLEHSEALAEARQRFGNPGKHFENARDVSLSVWLDEAARDARFAVRQLRKNPGFAVVAVAVIALGISAVATIFSLVSAVLLHALPYRSPEQLVYLWTPNLQFGASIPKEIAPSFPDFYDWQRTSRSFTSLAMVNQRMLNLATGDSVRRIGGAFVTGDFFTTLKAKPQLGRTISEADDVPAHANVVVISDAIWRERFSGERDVIGRVLTLNREKYSVIGVMPEPFGYPLDGDIPYVAPGFRRTDVWLPLAVANADKTDRTNFNNVDAAIGRLRPGVSAAQVQSELAIVEKRLDVLYPAAQRGFQVLVVSIPETILGPVRKLLWLLLATVACVLLIACGNVANLLLARVSGRLQEIALRAGLGAGRGRLARQMLTEAVVLALLGGATGVALTLGAVRILASLNPGNIPRFDQTSVNVPVLALALTISVLTGVLLSVAPMQTALRSNLADLLKRGSKGAAGASNRLRHALIVSEVAVSFVLLAGSGLLIRSYLKLQAEDPGFAQSTLTMSLTADGRYNRPEQRTQLFFHLLERLRHLPGVIEAGAGNDLPLDHSESIGPVQIKGFGQPKDWLDTRWVTPGYFGALGMRILAGRVFDQHDMKNVASAVVVNQAFAKAYMRRGDPLTFQIRSGSNMPSRPWASVVGVVADMKHSALEETPRPQYFQPYPPTFDASNVHLAVRSNLPPQVVMPSIRRSLHDLDPALAFDDIRTMGQRMAEANARRRFQMALLSAFAALAVFLAMIGVYGVLSYSVRQRTPEIGLRMALGASSRQVLTMIARQGLSLVATGLTIGVFAAFALTRTIRAWLYGIAPNDSLTFILLPLLVLAIASFACVLPALRASRIDPSVAIRND